MEPEFQRFSEDISAGDCLNRLRLGLIGEGVEYSTPFGQKKLVYADYVASGRALRQVEDFVSNHVLPFYANSHTQASHCGAHTTRLREGARKIIANQVNAGPECAVIFTGSGATSAVNRLVELCGISRVARGKATVFVGPYEHHSNILPWRESGAEVVEIDEAAQGGPDLGLLENELEKRHDSDLLVGAFSAASNVTGIITNPDPVSQLLKKHNALSFWDYAGAGPYLEMDMASGKHTAKDAVFFSPHKFAGGPGASGILVVKKDVARSRIPTWPGGGSVSYVSPWDHDYVDNISEREEAGTPNIVGDIRAALVVLIKSAVGVEFIKQRDGELGDKALAVWRSNPRLHLLGVDKPDRLPVFSFLVRDRSGGYVHHQLVTRMLSDVYGVQARGGCACAGPYGHRLLGVDRQLSEQMRAHIRAGREMDKPGWTRLNFSYLMDDETAAHIVRSVDELARDTKKYVSLYAGDTRTGQFEYRMPAPGSGCKRAG